MHDLYCSFPFCHPNIRTTHISRVLISPRPLPVEAWATTSNERVHFGRPFGGIPRCSGRAFQDSSLLPCCPRAIALPVLTVIWHSGLLKIITWEIITVHSPLHFPVWRGRQRDVSDENIEHGGGKTTSRNWKEFQGIWGRRNVRDHLVPFLLFIQSFYFTGKKAWGPETLNDFLKVSQLVGAWPERRPLDFQPVHRIAFSYQSQSQLFSACFLKILRVDGCTNPCRIPFQCLPVSTIRMSIISPPEVHWGLKLLEFFLKSCPSLWGHDEDKE